MCNCNICQTPMNPIFTGKILQKYNVQYFQCPKCGFISTEKPYWLDEAYSDAIADSDTGYVYRNLDFAKRISRILKQNNSIFSNPTIQMDFRLKITIKQHSLPSSADTHAALKPERMVMKRKNTKPYNKNGKYRNS